MPKRSNKGPRNPDVNQTAWRVVQEATTEDEKEEEAPAEKNSAAVALGRLGGKKGGKARAEALSKEQRSKIPKKAAEARWKNQKGESK